MQKEFKETSACAEQSEGGVALMQEKEAKEEAVEKDEKDYRLIKKCERRRNGKVILHHQNKCYSVLALGNAGKGKEIKWKKK